MPVQEDENQARESVKARILKRISQIVEAKAKDAGLFSGHEETAFNLSETVQHYVNPSLKEIDGKVSLTTNERHTYNSVLFALRPSNRNFEGATPIGHIVDQYAEDARKVDWMLYGSLQTASELGRGKAAKIHGGKKSNREEDSIIFPSLLDLGMAVNALTKRQDQKIDLSPLEGLSP